MTESKESLKNVTVRVPIDLHTKAKIKIFQDHITWQKLLISAIEDYVDESTDHSRKKEVNPDE